MSNMLCPGCGKYQAKADNCSSCGIAIARLKYRTSQQITPKHRKASQGYSTYKLLFTIGVAIGLAVAFDIPEILKGVGSAANYQRPLVLDKARNGNGIKQYDFIRLFDSKKPFSSLAKQNYYTVVEGYLDSCPICKRMEADFPAFLTARKDVLIRRVHFPEGGMNLSFTGNTQVEVERQAQDYNERMASYDFCGTPHIEIYDANKQLIVADTCKQRLGTHYLRKWMADESH